MGIENFLSRVSKQTCVYWGSPENNGYGGKTFADPVELSCRWEYRKEIVPYDKIKNIRGDEMYSHCIVYISEDVEEGGMMWLGTLAELVAANDSDAVENPINVTNAFEIKRIDKFSSLINSSEYYRKIYLTPFGGI